MIRSAPHYNGGVMKKKKNKRKNKLTSEQVRKMMEEKLRAKTIPSKKKYNRTRKHKKEES